MKGVKVLQWLYIIIPTSLHKEKKEQQCRIIEVLLEVSLPQHLLARQPKARRRHLRCCRRRQPPGQGPDHHYYHFLPP
jgi:hypothetical protein